MPSTKQAAKRVRQDSARRITNRARKSKIRTSARNIDEALEKGDAAAVAAAYKLFQEGVDKAAKARTIHPNAANRRKSRMAKKIAAAAKKG
jgi:small subunit ribosomal protein S20